MGPGRAVSGHKAYFRQSPLEIHFYRTVWPAPELLRSKGVLLFQETQGRLSFSRRGRCWRPRKVDAGVSPSEN